MHDILREEQFLLYSPGITRTRSDVPDARYYFLLLGFNGHCWQSYGPIAYFHHLTVHDVFYLGTRLRPGIESSTDLCRLIEEDPFPFIMLFRAAVLPLTVSKGDVMIVSTSDVTVDEFDPMEHKNRFTIQEREGIFKLSLKRWSSSPHYAACYFDPDDNRLFLCSATLQSYEKLSDALAEKGYDLPIEPEHAVNLSMWIVIKQILNLDESLSPYEHLFREVVPEKQQKELDNINLLLRDMFRAINDNRSYDLAKLASKYKVEIEMARQLERSVLDAKSQESHTLRRNKRR